ERVAKALVNKGVTLGDLKRSEEEIKVYDDLVARFGQAQELAIQEQVAKALFNKGITLGNLKRSEEAIKVADELIARFGHAQEVSIQKLIALSYFNKGNKLINLGKSKDALSCYKKAILLNPNYPEVYGNLGILYLNLNKYKLSENTLKKAVDLFKYFQRTKDVRIAKKLLLLAQDTQALITKLNDIDKQFIYCPKLKEFSNIKKTINELAKKIKQIKIEYSKKDIPPDAKNLLNAKTVCFIELAKAVNFKPINNKELEYAKKVFKTFKLKKLVNAAKTIESIASKNKKVKQVKLKSKRIKAESQIKKELPKTLVLDGFTTEKISDGIKQDKSPYQAKSIEKKEDKLKFITRTIPNIKRIVDQNKIRVGLVQIDYEVTAKTPRQLVDKEEIKKKILQALEIAQKEEVDIVCFPELCFDQEFINEVKKYNTLIIIGGSYHSAERFNICPLFIKGQDPINIRKIHPSPFLEKKIAPNTDIIPGDEIYILETENHAFRFTVLICMDYRKEARRVCEYGLNGRKGVHIVFVPQYNPGVKLFHDLANAECIIYPHIYVIQSNVNKTNDNEQYGGSCVFGEEHPDTLKRIQAEGYRTSNDYKNKIYDLNDEQMLIADLNLTELSRRSDDDSSPKNEVIARYIYEKDGWQKKQ
ncbi:MAG: tetratricopeptide repeat protein, partial [bacterium]